MNGHDRLSPRYCHLRFQQIFRMTIFFTTLLEDIHVHDVVAEAGYRDPKGGI